MKKKLLVVEKNKDIVEILDYILSTEGYEVEVLRDPENLENYVRHYKPHAIILDVIVVKSSATDVCKNLKKNVSTSNIPIIVITTDSQVSAVIKEICADEVIDKPFDIYTLLETIENQLAA